MKQKVMVAFSALALVALIACTTTAQRKVYNSLATTGIAEESSYEAYLAQVLSGAVATNDVPVVTARHRDFKALFDAACVSASMLTNITETPPAVTEAGSAVTSAISTAKSRR